MASYDAVCISSDDESPFYRNQRLLKEYHEEEDRRRVQSYLSRVLNEVIEGKRHTLRIAARPEPSKIPIAIPLTLPLEVTVAYKPSELKFNVMSQGSQTESVSPPQQFKLKVHLSGHSYSSPPLLTIVRFLPYLGTVVLRYLQKSQLGSPPLLNAAATLREGIKSSGIPPGARNT